MNILLQPKYWEEFGEKFQQKKISKKLMGFCCLTSQKPSIFDVFDNFRKSGYGRCSNSYKTCKNRRKFKIQKKFENLILELPFGTGFIEIHQLARFVQHFEKWRFFSIFDPIFENVPKRLTLKVGICNKKLYCVFDYIF